MMGILKKLMSARKNRATYRVGLLQAKAYRILKHRTGVVLAPHGISTMEWALLGLIYDAGQVRPSDSAYELGVEAPFVTAMVASLSKKGLVLQEKDKEDSRAKVLFLTPKGKVFVEETETQVRAGMRSVITGAGAGDLLGYLSILEKIIENDESEGGQHN